MRKILLILSFIFTLTVNAQTDTLFFCNFDVDSCNFDYSGILRRYCNSAYGDPPSGSCYLSVGASSSYGWHDAYLSTPLNLIADSTYHISFYYRCLSGSDTIAILTTDTAATTSNHARLAGVADHVIPSASVWTFYEFDIKPTASGGYFHILTSSTSAYIYDNLLIAGYKKTHLYEKRLRVRWAN